MGSEDYVDKIFGVKTLAEVLNTTGDECQKCDSDNRKRLTKALALRELTFISLAEKSGDAIVRFDLHLRMTYINPVFEKVCGIPMDRMLFRNLSDFYIFSEQGCIEDKLRMALCGDAEIDAESEYFDADGRRGWLHLRIIPEFGIDDEAIGVILVGRDISNVKNAREQVEFLAYHDVLTGLPNMLLAKDRAEQMFARSRRSGDRVAFLFVDLDDFKSVNNSYGHAFGDMILEFAAQRVKGCVRMSDTVARHGGDEFLMLLPDIRDMKSVTDIAMKIIDEMSRPFVVDENSFTLGASIGISIYPDDGEEFEVLYKKADIAMYEAKGRGKNAYRFFAKDMQDEISKYLRIRGDLGFALERGEFELFYQPQIDVKKGTLLGVETLLRWRHPSEGLVLPDDFIPVAENCGLIVRMGEWVLNEACMQAVKWQHSGLGKIIFAVNISAIQFKRENLLEIVKTALEVSGLQPEYLELEITESVIIKNTESVVATLKELKQMGVKISIDDFGTGYSSLSYLKKFAVDKLKIDKSFVIDMDKNKEDAAIVEAVVKMAKSLNLRTIAEGVESEEALSMLAMLECDEAQGFYIAKPMPAYDFEKFFY